MPHTLLRLALAAALFAAPAARAAEATPPTEPKEEAKAEPVKPAEPAAEPKQEAKPAEPKPEPKKADAKPAEPTPVGRWKTIDDSTKKAKSIVVIWQDGGKLFGKIEKLLNPDTPDPKCDKCEGDLKDKPITGMRIMWDLTKDGDEWSGGRILDPENGKNYKCYIALEDGGKKLKIRGYVGFALLGRTQYWYPAE